MDPCGALAPDFLEARPDTLATGYAASSRTAPAAGGVVCGLWVSQMYTVGLAMLAYHGIAD